MLEVPGADAPVPQDLVDEIAASDGDAGSGGEPVRRGDALVVGYATPPDSAWSGALDALCRVLPGPEPAVRPRAPHI